MTTSSSIRLQPPRRVRERDHGRPPPRSAMDPGDEPDRRDAPARPVAPADLDRDRLGRRLALGRGRSRRRACRRGGSPSPGGERLSDRPARASGRPRGVRPAAPSGSRPPASRRCRRSAPRRSAREPAADLDDDRHRRGEQERRDRQLDQPVAATPRPSVGGATILIRSSLSIKLDQRVEIGHGDEADEAPSASSTSVSRTWPIDLEPVLEPPGAPVGQLAEGPGEVPRASGRFEQGDVGTG